MINTETPLQSTIEELEDMLTINIEHEYQNFKVIFLINVDVRQLDEAFQSHGWTRKEIEKPQSKGTGETPEKGKNRP